MNRLLLYSLVESAYLIRDSSKLMEADNPVRGLVDTLTEPLHHFARYINAPELSNHVNKFKSKLHDWYVKSREASGKAHEHPAWLWGAVPGGLTGAALGLKSGIKSGTNEGLTDLAKYGAGGLGAGMIAGHLYNRSQGRRKRE